MTGDATIFAKPSPLLEQHLQAAGIHWSSVLSVSQWHALWDSGAVPQKLQKDFQAFDAWVANDAHAGMLFLEKNSDVRRDPRKILDGVESILSVIIPYAHGHTTRGQATTEAAQTNDKATVANDFTESIARYARVPDYHKAIKKVLTQVMSDWQTEALAQGAITDSVGWRVATDSLPFLDRAHARLAGLGFIGKNTMLIRPGVGSYFFIAHVLVNAPFQIIAAQALTPPTAAHAITSLDCGECRLCIEACPTSALTADRFLNSNRCLSYLTIEHRDVIPDEFVPHLGEHLYGCDLCQDACPYNLKTLPLQTIEPFQEYHRQFSFITTAQVARMSQSEYENWFGGTAMTRAKYGGLVRNALYQLFAKKSSELKGVLDARTNDPNPLIAATVAHIRRLSRHHSDHDPQ